MVRIYGLPIFVVFWIFLCECWSNLSATNISNRIFRVRHTVVSSLNVFVVILHKQSPRNPWLLWGRQSIRDTSQGRAMSWTPRNQGTIPCRGKRCTASSFRATQFSIQLIPGVLSQGVKLWGYEANHSPPSSDEVKNIWTYTPNPSCTFMARCLVN